MSGKKAGSQLTRKNGRIQPQSPSAPSPPALLVIITRYLVKETFTTLFGVLLVLMLIASTGQLVEQFSKVAEGTIKADTVMTLFGIYSLTTVPFIVPLALYLGILLALSRLYMNSELTVLEACGYGPWRLLGPVLLVAVTMGAVQGAFTLWLSPWASFQGERMEKLMQKSLSIEGITPGRFRSLPEGMGVIYAERISEDRTRVYNVFAQVRLRDGHETLLVAESGHLEEDRDSGARYLVLENGHRYEGRPGRDDFAVIRFERHGLRMRAPAERGIDYHLRAVPTAELWQRPQQPGYGAELQWRIAWAVLVPVLALLAVPLSRTSPRSGRYGRLALAFVFYLVINNLMNVARSWLEAGKVPPVPGIWWVHVAVALTGLGLIAWQLGRFRRAGRRG